MHYQYTTGTKYTVKRNGRNYGYKDLIKMKDGYADYNTDPTTDFIKGIMGSIDDIFRILKRK